MYGNSVGSLSVKIKVYPSRKNKPYTRLLWTQQLNHGDVWLTDTVQINSPDDFEVKANGTSWDWLHKLILKFSLDAQSSNHEKEYWTENILVVNRKPSL